MVEKHSDTHQTSSQDDIDKFIESYSTTNTKLFDEFKGKLPEKVIAKNREKCLQTEAFKDELVTMAQNAYNITQRIK